MDSLDKFKDTDPKKYWKLVSSLTEQSDDKSKSVQTEDWQDFFSNMNRTPPPPPPLYTKGININKIHIYL